MCDFLSPFGFPGIDECGNTPQGTCRHHPLLAFHKYQVFHRPIWSALLRAPIRLPPLMSRVHWIGSSKLGRLGGYRGCATPLRGDRKKVSSILDQWPKTGTPGYGRIWLGLPFFVHCFSLFELPLFNSKQGVGLFA